MKVNLEKRIKQAKLFLAASLSALALYSSGQDTAKLDAGNDGSWRSSSDATLYFQSTTGSQGRNLKNNKANQFITPIYFSGRKTSEKELEFFYATTDLADPAQSAPTLDNNNTKIYFFSEADATAEIIYQKVAMLNTKGEVTFEETVLEKRRVVY